MKKLFLILLVALVFAAPSLAQTNILVREEASESILEQIQEWTYVETDLLDALLDRQIETHCWVELMPEMEEKVYASTCVFDDMFDDRKVIYLNIHSSDERSSTMRSVLLFRDLHIVGQSFSDEVWGATILRVGPPPGRYDAFFIAGSKYVQMSFEIYS